MGEMYFAKGKVTVHAKGYWFTSGGEKGAFGFYPHLKDEHCRPVYPDTQIHGDLHMAALWLSKLDSSTSVEMIRMINRVFGESGASYSSRLFISDLKPDDGFSPVFQVKPRTKINECRITEKNMLVNFELAYLEGSRLCADIYLGYFDDIETLEKAKRLVCESASMLSGFGAFRSRGYGRGSVSIEWNKEVCIKYDEGGNNTDVCKKPDDTHDKSECEGKGNEKECVLFLEPLVNFRSKEIEPGTGQLLDSRKSVSSSQFRGWFVKTYNRLFDGWPTVEDMKTITIPDFYYSILSDDTYTLGYPAPVSTVRYDKDGATIDLWGKGEDKSDNNSRDKSKSLSPSEFVTDETPSRIIELETENRMRNSTNSNFSTKDKGGLFAQEFVKRGSLFGGKVRISNPESAFGEKALFILSNDALWPVINGCVFLKHIKHIESSETNNQADTTKPPKPFLVVSPIDYDESVRSSNGDQITIASFHRYNVTLRRPRRNRIVIMPGSVISKRRDGKTIQWPGFGLPLTEGQPEEQCGKRTPEEQKHEVIEEQKKDTSMSRSQAGQLMELLSPAVTYVFLEKFISKRLEKYKNKTNIEKSLIPPNILEAILVRLSRDISDKNKLNEIGSAESEKLKSNNLKDAKEFIKSVLDEYKLSEWKASCKETREKFETAASKKGYTDD
ncbi:MAG: hypothetical protein HQK89_06715 [Nitrospirae bacterium]|nr:hypothetical protein [Nitrospirota bacterium]